jgi:hypothetical protein
LGLGTRRRLGLGSCVASCLGLGSRLGWSCLGLGSWLGLAQSLPLFGWSKLWLGARARLAQRLLGAGPCLAVLVIELR